MGFCNKYFDFFIMLQVVGTSGPSHQLHVLRFWPLFQSGMYYRNDPKFSDIRLGKQCRPRSFWSGSTLFAIPSACFGCNTLMVEPLCSNFRGLQQIFQVSEYLGLLRYLKEIICKVSRLSFSVVLIKENLADRGETWRCMTVLLRCCKDFRTDCSFTAREVLYAIYLLIHMSRDMTKWVRPAKTLISLGTRPVLLESSLSAWRKLGSSATHWAHNWTDAPADLRLRWAHTCFVGFVMSQLIFSCSLQFRVSNLSMESWSLFMAKWPSVTTGLRWISTMILLWCGQNK